MKYLTRQRYQAIQRDSRKAERDWQEAGNSYEQEVRLARRHLPASARALSRLTFHDSIVRALDPAPRDRIRLVLDSTHNPWGPRVFRLDFLDVVGCSARGPVVGDWWLYEEFHLHGRGLALHVLLARSSLVITASDIILTELPKTPRPRGRSPS